MPATRPAPAYHHGDLKRSLVDAAIALVAEKQAWDFSLREVARRAGVSHNAPYNHFADKRDLLAAVAAAGYEALRADMADAAEKAGDAEAVLVAIGSAYVHFGTGNPARYRRMFGAALSGAGTCMPDGLMQAATAAKSVLADAVLCCAREGRLAAAADDAAGIGLAVLSAWSLVHGLTMLLIDGLAGDAVPFAVGEHVAASLLAGLRKR